MNILYCGDQDKAPLYIGGALEFSGHQVTYIKPDQSLPAIGRFDAFILSDYPARGLDDDISTAIISEVEDGKRFLMFGGWESFNGFGRNYFAHRVGKLLVPALMQKDDDRVNASQGLLLRHLSSGEAATEPDWDKPPVICGYNAADAKEGTETLVNMQEIVADNQSVRVGATRPLVIKGSYGTGTTIACLTDLAPHWSGGLTDWGEPVQLTHDVQVGSSYIKFIQFLLEA